MTRERHADALSRGVALDAWAMAGLIPATWIMLLDIIWLAVGTSVPRRAS